MSEIKSVLIVEDDSFQAHLLKMLLTNLDYDVVAVSSTGEEAVDLTSKLMPQTIFMDIALGGEIDGIEAVKRIYEKFPAVKIIYLTGNSDSAHKNRAEYIGFDDFLIKPINKQMLVDSLSKVLS